MVNPSLILLTVGLLSPAGLVLMSSPVDIVPPSFYVSKGACPFECCTYRDWTARRELALLDRPGGGAIGRIRNREIVRAITGEVHTKPLQFRVKRDGPYDDGVPAGSVVYLLHPVGEGAWLVWFKGKTVVIDPDYGRRGPDYQWWAKVRTRSGRVGWVLMKDAAFDNVDACG